MQANALDHVALWVADRDTLADFACRHLGMHVIDRTDDFTLVGADARRGKLTLFAAEGPRERGPLEHVALRVADLGGALAQLPEGLAIEHRRQGEAYFEVCQGVVLGLPGGAHARSPPSRSALRWTRAIHRPYPTDQPYQPDPPSVFPVLPRGSRSRACE